MMSKLVEIKGLELGYGPQKNPATVIGPLDLDIFEGESLGIIGESGAGKSTVGFEILGVLQFKQGHRRAGNLQCQVSKEKIAYIPQDPLSSLDPLFSIGYQMRELGASLPQIKKALEQVHLNMETLSLKSYPHELSGGMRQRLTIAMALLKQPKLVIADEPTSSLDVTLQAEVIRLFRDIQAAGVTFVFITHNLPLAAQFCSRLAVMKDGKLIEVGESAGVINNPAQVYTRNLIESIPGIKL